jgi:hypothetical protein
VTCLERSVQRPRRTRSHIITVALQLRNDLALLVEEVFDPKHRALQIFELLPPCICVHGTGNPAACLGFQAVARARSALRSSSVTTLRAMAPKFFKAVADLGFEGIVSKRAAGRYRSGPSRSWLKIKNMLESEFILLGTDRNSDGVPWALLASERDGRLEFAGRLS